MAFLGESGTFRYGTFYEGLSAEARSSFEQHCRLRSYKQGEVIFRQGDINRYALLLRDGAVKVSSRSVAGKQTLLDIRTAGDLVGDEESLAWLTSFGEQIGSPPSPPPRSKAVTALEPLKGLLISSRNFNRFLALHPEGWATFAKDLQNRLRAAEVRIGLAASETANQRLARALLSLSIRGHKERPRAVRLTQAELASWIGASRGTVERTLRGWRKRKIIETAYCRIYVQEPEQLFRISGWYASEPPLVARPAAGRANLVSTERPAVPVSVASAA